MGRKLKKWFILQRLQTVSILYGVSTPIYLSNDYKLKTVWILHDVATTESTYNILY